MNPKFKLLYRSVITLLIALVAMTTILSSCKDRNTTGQNINQSRYTPATAAYTVREYGGRIAVFSGDNSNPDYILESPLVRDLPFADRQALGEGVEVSNTEELSEVLQDYDN